MTLIEWVFGTGSVIVGIALGAYGFDFKLPGLWIGFVGASILLLAFTLQLQNLILQSTARPIVETPSVFVIGMQMAFGHSIGLIKANREENGRRIVVAMSTLIGQPTVQVIVQSVDRSAFDVDMAAGFLIDNALPPEPPAISPPDKPTPGVPIPNQEKAIFNAVCPFVISKAQEEAIAHKRQFFMVYGWVKYRGNQPHKTGFAGIWDVTKSAFDLPKQSGYNYQK